MTSRQLSLCLNDARQLELLPTSNASNRDSYGEMLSALNVQDSPTWPDDFGKSLRNWMRSHERQPIRTLSLFSGGGGLDIAFHDAGFNIVEMVEIEERYVATLCANTNHSIDKSDKSPEDDTELGATLVRCIDIRDYQPEELDVELIIGGPPCQTFSAAGRRASGVRGTTDERGTLFQEYVRLLQSLQPKAFVFENVYGITGAEGGVAWKEIQAAFRSAGFKIFSRVLDAADFGVPQHRERLFIVGVQEAEEQFLFPRPTHGPDSPNGKPFHSAGQAVQNVPAPDLNENTTIGGRYGDLVASIPPGLNYSFYTAEMGHPRPVFAWRSKFSDFLYKADPATPVRTIKAQGGLYTGPFSWENRHFTVEEHKRLQTFPDDYKLVGNRSTRLEQIGNSVPPQIARILALAIRQQIFGRAVPFDLPLLSPHEELGFRRRKRALTQSYSSKAKAAHEQRIERHTPNLSGKDEPLIRFLRSDFELMPPQSPEEWERSFVFECIVEKNTFQIRGSRPLVNRDEIYTLNLKVANAQQWLLPWNNVQLVALDGTSDMFVSLWKALEEIARLRLGIADLIQLNGYYQYPPKIAVEIDFSEVPFEANFSRALKEILSRRSVATLLTNEELAARWEIDIRLVEEILNRLRSFGYEIRSHNTNPQIPAGCFLIPYSFPTLCRRSIQGRKKL